MVVGHPLACSASLSSSLFKGLPQFLDPCILLFFNNFENLFAFCQHVESDWFYTLKFYYVPCLLQSIQVFFAVCLKNVISADVILVWYFAFIVQLSPQYKIVSKRLEYYEH
jgi:hypothetical protein